MKVSFGAKSDVGLKRERNEDAMAADPELGLFVVCDGMGGRNAGDEASRMATEIIQEHVQDGCDDAKLPMIGESNPKFSTQTNRLASAIRLANQVVVGASSRDPNNAGMGTTVVCAMFTGESLSIAHVGDSRLYLIREGAIRALTADHSLVAEQVRRGMLTEEQAERSAQKHIITRALGIEQRVDVDLDELLLKDGDFVLLCSDGLTRGVHPKEILNVLEHETDPQAASEELVQLANDAGGEDNTTVIILAFEKSTGSKILKQIWRRIGGTRLLPGKGNRHAENSAEIS
ncbi:MAG: Stp1/IreP family PP2C-type Ser/Thr phosphatase [Anaerolineales bacterium]